MYKESENRLRRIQQAETEHSKYTEEQAGLDTWLLEAEDKLRQMQRVGASSLDSLANQEDALKDFSQDVNAHQGDLRFLNMQAQRFIDQAKVRG